MDYSNLEVKGVWMLASILLCVRREQNPSFKHGAIEINAAVRARAAGEAELRESSPGKQSTKLDPIAFCIQSNGQHWSRDSLDHPPCCLKIPRENISDWYFSESPFPTKGLKENFVHLMEMTLISSSAAVI